MDFTIFLLAQIPPFLYAITNLIDKNLLDKYFPENGEMTLVIFSALASIILVPLALVIEPDVMSISLKSIAVLALVSVINTLLLWSYLKALAQEDPTVVIICYQMVPVLTLVSGELLLGETLNTGQLMAMAIIMLGTFIAGIDFKTEGKLTLKWRTLFFMGIACLCWSSETVIFKTVAIDEAVWPSIFWASLIQVFIGILLFAFFKKDREIFLERFRSHGRRIFALNVTNEVLYLGGTTVTYLAAMQTAVALVLLAQTFQAIYVFGLGILASLLIKSLHKEQLDRRSVAAKLVAIAITGVGSYMLLSA